MVMDIGLSGNIVVGVVVVVVGLLFDIGGIVAVVVVVVGLLVD
jgi:hypothetical protein